MLSSAPGMQNSQQMMVCDGVVAGLGPDLNSGLSLSPIDLQPGSSRCLVDGKDACSYFLPREVPERLELVFQVFGFTDNPDDVSRRKQVTSESASQPPLHLPKMPQPGVSVPIGLCPLPGAGLGPKDSPDCTKKACSFYRDTNRRTIFMEDVKCQSLIHVT